MDKHFHRRNPTGRQKPITISQKGESARTLRIVLPDLGYESPDNMVPVIMAAQRQWKFKTVMESPARTN